MADHLDRVAKRLIWEAGARARQEQGKTHLDNPAPGELGGIRVVVVGMDGAEASGGGDMSETAVRQSWRQDLLELLTEDDAEYALDFLVAVGTELHGDAPAALEAAGRALIHLGDACGWVMARVDEEDRRLQELRPYRNLTLADRRRIDLAPMRLEKDAELRAAMLRHVGLLPELEGTALRILAARTLGGPRSN